MNTVAESISRAARSLSSHSESPRLDAELLLGKILGLSRAGLIARSNEPVSGESQKSLANLLEERRRGTPVAYLTGTREFWSLALHVTPAVLVPRPETEILVDLALQRLPEDQAATVLDLGTGSGAIALAIAAERPLSQVTGVDISAAALEIARQNASALHLTRIDWRLGSWFAPVVKQRFDMIVANPPYIAAADPALERLAAEPAIALCDGPTGLEALSTIAAGAASHLTRHGWLLLEHGSTQGPEVARLLHSHGFSSVRSHPDFSGKLRVTLGTLHSPP
ncbi:MAG TPA: peptide chain release factor N(5)-glutamine methyltransferase [Steroidobacteraceae bacterium]